MKSNFQFMDEKWPDLAKHGRFAELYLYTDPDACMYKLGKLAEQLVKKLFVFGGLSYENYTHYERIDYAFGEKLIDDRKIYNILHVLRKERNKNAHEDVESLKKAQARLQDSYSLCCWFMKKYGGNPYFEAESYHEPEKIVPKVRSIIDRCPDCENTFVGRVLEMEEIYEKLDNNAPVFVTGTRGIGKTELVKNYARRFRSEYDVICYSEYRGSLSEMIANGELVAIRSNQEEEITIDTIAELVDSRTLIIIDNYSVSNGDKSSYEILYHLASLKCRLLITTTDNIRDLRSSAQIIEISELPQDEQYELFEKEFGVVLSDDDSHVAELIITAIHGYTLLIPLIAKLLKTGSMDFREALEKIQEDGALNFSEHIYYTKDGKIFDGSIESIVQSVLNLSSLSENERFVLKCISSLKGAKIERGKLLDWIGRQYHEAINQLSLKRWITVGGSGRAALLSVHGIISDVVNRDPSMPYDPAWIHRALMEYLDNTNDPDALFSCIGISRFFFPSDIKMRVRPIRGRASGLLAFQNGKRREVMENLLQSVVSDQDPGALIDILYSINNEDMDRVYNFAPDCDELLQRMESSASYDGLDYKHRIKLHILRVYLALKSLCDCGHTRGEGQILSLCKTAISQSDKAIGLLNDYEDGETMFRVTYDVIYNAFLTCGITFGCSLFSIHESEYSANALHDYSEYVNLLSDMFYEDYSELFNDEVDYVVYTAAITIDYFNICMSTTPDRNSAIIAEDSLDPDEEWDEFTYHYNHYLNNMGTLERRVYHDAQRIGESRKEADEIVRQCEHAGYRAVDDPEAYPEISVDLLTDAVKLKEAGESLAAAKRKFTKAEVLEKWYFASIDANSDCIEEIVLHDAMHPLDTSSAMCRLWASSCIYCCCVGDFDSAKENYTRFLHEHHSLFESSPGLAMYRTLRYLGYTDLCPQILKMNIQFYQESIAQFDDYRNDPERDWQYSPDSVLHAVSEIVHCADLLDDEDMKRKYMEIKRRIETPGFEFEDN